MTVELQAQPGTAALAQPGTAALPLGFRFHPTDEELIVHYLRKRAAAAPCPVPIIAEVDIYKLDPWDLPSRAVFGQPEDNEWYFFSPRDRKYPNGVRPSRSAGSGYWKATGIDKPITGRGGEMVGVKKALVFYQGRPPKGVKTSWTMHEYRLADATRTPVRFNKDSSSMRLDDWVLCRIYKKPSQQLSPLYDLSPSPASMDASYHGQQDHQHLQDHSSSSSGRMLPRPHSISDYLADYSAVWELFHTMPPAPDIEGSTGRFFLGSSGDDKASTAWKWQTSTVDSNDDGGGNMSSLPASKRWLSSDASMTMLNNTYSMFGPDGPDQPSQDRGELRGFAESPATAPCRK